MGGTHVFRNLPAIVPGKGEVFMADPRLIVVDPDYNCRDMNSADTIAHVDWLADEIEARGFNPEMPLTVKRRGDDMIVLRGHCRLAGCMKAIDRGVELRKIPVMQIGSGMSDLDLIFDQESSNYGLRLDEFAKGRLCLKARRLGLEDDEIARRMHWKSVASVQQHIKMVEVIPEPVKQQVAQGDISATEAMKLVKNLPAGTNPEFAADLIAKNKEENKRLGIGKRTNHKVTARTLQRDRPQAVRRFSEPEPDPKPEPFVAEVEISDEQRVAVEAAAAAMRDQLASALAAPQETEPHPQLQTAAEREQPRSMSVVLNEVAEITAPARTFPPEALQPPTPARDIDRAMFAIIGELAAIGEGQDLNERDDNDKIEVTAGIIKRADRIYRQRIGDTSAEEAA